MALVELYHVVAANRAVKSGTTIKEGMIVSLDVSGEVVPVDGTNAWPYGIAGDTKSTSTSSMPGVASGWQNRASDYFDETKSSAKMTVYHSGGEFATDQFLGTDIDDSTAPGTLLYPTIAGILGVVGSDAGAGVPVARLLVAAGAYMSGVPGTDINGDIALGGENDNEYIQIKLLV
jgi:hypothetical protein